MINSFSWHRNAKIDNVILLRLQVTPQLTEALNVTKYFSKEAQNISQEMHKIFLRLEKCINSISAINIKANQHAKKERQKLTNPTLSDFQISFVDSNIWNRRRNKFSICRVYFLFRSEWVERFSGSAICILSMLTIIIKYFCLLLADKYGLHNFSNNSVIF